FPPDGVPVVRGTRSRQSIAREDPTNSVRLALQSSCRVLTGSSPRGEVLVGTGGVLALPLIELLPQRGIGAIHVQAQATVLVLERIGTVGLLDRKPEAVWRTVGHLLDDVR